MSQNWFWQFTTQWPWPRNSESCNSMIGLVALSWFAVELHCGHIDIQPDDIQGHIQGEGYLFAHWLFKILALYESLTDLLIYLLLLQRLQVIPQNAAARLVTGTRKYEQMTPVVRDLHWLPVRQFITCFTALLVYQSVSAWSGVDIDCNLLPAVIAHVLDRAFQSTVSRFTSIFRPMHQGRAFSITWNSLPAVLRSRDISLKIFAKRLIFFLFVARQHA